MTIEEKEQAGLTDEDVKQLLEECEEFQRHLLSGGTHGGIPTFYIVLMVIGHYGLTLVQWESLDDKQKLMAVSYLNSHKQAQLDVQRIAYEKEQRRQQEARRRR